MPGSFAALSVALLAERTIKPTMIQVERFDGNLPEIRAFEP
ncbi:MAG TPA: hypothetical protein VD840_05855 [Sinorhizobium sp.]|nr:hypothetical protein [Sinorhizobium sp.]